jgi:uncharacterized protein YqfA (UPF0365 family)
MHLDLAPFTLFARAPRGGGVDTSTILGWGALIFVGLLALIIVLLFFKYFNLWIQAWLTRANIGIPNMIGMSLRKVNVTMLVQQKIALTQAGVRVENRDLEAHYLARGNVPKTAAACIAAYKAGIDLPWKTAAAIDLAGRDVYDAVRTSVNPKVIDCPDPTKGARTLDAVAKNGIQLKVKARVTVQTKLERLVGGATEETIIARVGQGIVSAIGSAEDHKAVLANPSIISKEVLDKGLDSATAFHIVSIDIADVEVGENIGANLQAAQAQADLKVAQAKAEERRAAAVAREQEMRALVEENRAKVVESEAQVPMAISSAIRDGKFGVMDYYNLRNLVADTEMRSSIAGTSPNQNRGV